jgi:hypothetical protein
LALCHLASKILVMDFTRFLIEVHIGTHVIASSFML